MRKNEQQGSYREIGSPTQPVGEPHVNVLGEPKVRLDMGPTERGGGRFLSRSYPTSSAF